MPKLICWISKIFKISRRGFIDRDQYNTVKIKLTSSIRTAKRIFYKLAFNKCPKLTAYIMA